MLQAKRAGRKQLAALVDPDKVDIASLPQLVADIGAAVDYIFVGGSLLGSDIAATVAAVKAHTTKPVLLFPGHCSHICEAADAILLLSLLSGRNPEFLIGNHVIAAPFLHRSRMEVISTAYILVDGGCTTSVQYISNTMPIPANKTDIIRSTAIAGEMLGQRLVYLEAGSGAVNPVPDEAIEAVATAVEMPVIVGGGLRSYDLIQQKFSAGADIIVIGNAWENNHHFFKTLHP